MSSNNYGTHSSKYNDTRYSQDDEQDDHEDDVMVEDDFEEGEVDYDEEEDDDEDSSLQRLSALASRRPRNHHGIAEDEDDEDDDDLVYEEFEDDDEGDGEEGEDEDGDEEGDEEEDDEFDMNSPAELLRRLIANNRYSNNSNTTNDNDEDNEDNEEEEEFDDPRAEFFRHVAYLTGSNNRTQSRDTPSQPPPQSFADMMQRLMNNGLGGGNGGGGAVFGSANGSSNPFGATFASSSGSSEFEHLVDNLNQREDSYIILETLNELSEKLLMMNGIIAERVIPSNKLAKSLVSIMNDPELLDHLELQLVACRCLYNFLEVNQDFVHDALNNHAVECLCGKLMEINYIDLTEQALQTLEMISRDTTSHHQIIVNNGLKAVLMYLDFLTTHAQRKCLSIVANACTNISFTNFSLIKDVFENITTVVSHHQDSLVIENGWLAISRIIMSFKLKPEFLEELFLVPENQYSLLHEMVNIILISSNKSKNDSSSNDNDTDSSGVQFSSQGIPVSFGSCLSLIKSLIILCSASVRISKILIDTCNIGEVIVKSLNKYSKNNSTINQKTITSKNSINNISIEALMIAPKELLSQFLNLVGYLLPISYTAKETPFLRNNYKEFDIKSQINSERCNIYKFEIPQQYWKFVNDIWSLLINSFQATMDYEIRRKTIINLTRIINFCQDVDDFNKIQGIEMITGILASVTNNSKGSILKDFQPESTAEISGGASSNDVEMLIEDDDQSQDAEHESETEEPPPVPAANSKKPEDISKLHSNILLLSIFMISQNLIKKSPGSFINEFEREGLFNDTLLILNSLKTVFEVAPGADEKEPEKTNSNVPPPIFYSAYTNKFIDTEFTKDYENKLTNDEIYQDLVNVAESIENLHLNIKPNTNEAVSESVRILKSINEVLENSKLLESYSYDEWIKLWTKLNSALDVSHGNSISSFELITSGIIESLSNLFTSDKLDRNNNKFGYNDYYRSFIEVFFVRDSNIVFLIQKLQECLTRSESFDIISSGGSTTVNSLYGSGLFKLYGSSGTNLDYNHTAVMAKQVKIRLIAEGDLKENKLPTSMQTMILSVHAIATFKSIESFLKQRYRFVEETLKTRRRLNGELDDEDEEDDDEEDLISEDNEGEVVDKQTSPRPGNDELINTEFLINDEIIPTETTIYGAIYRSLQGNPDETVDPTKIWTSIHTVYYRKVTNSTGNREDNDKSISYNFQGNDNEIENYDQTTINILKLLKILFEINSFNANNNKVVSDDLFTNYKLTAKLNRQLEEPLVVASGTLPGWSIHITKLFPFIFPLETRIFFLQSTSFGYSRLIHHWQIRTNQEYADNNASSNVNNDNLMNQRPQLGRPTRQKVRLSRKLILQSAVKVLQLYGSIPGILEIEYFDEVGSGLGPTLEFYATVSKEFSKKKLKLWRDDDDDNEEDHDHEIEGNEGFVLAQHGLFPRPLDKHQIFSENGRKVVYFFATLGKFIARALLDSRIIDFNFNPVFLQLIQILNQNSNQVRINKDVLKLTNLSILRVIDPSLADSLKHLLKYVQQYNQCEDVNQKRNVTVDSCTLEDLSLTFTLPGYPDYELTPGGDEVLITHENVELYINKVIEATIYSGIIHQTKAFMEGFSKVFPINSLIIFSAQELIEMFGSGEEDWSLSTLQSSINANHGYTKESDAIKLLIDTLVSFNKIERRAFLQFLTGSPKLPIGGFKSLRPELTVVRKFAEDGLKDDDYLPSVMTCANYLKLPNYSSLEVMKQRLVQAVNEGAGAFLLS